MRGTLKAVSYSVNAWDIAKSISSDKACFFVIAARSFSSSKKTVSPGFNPFSLRNSFEIVNTTESISQALTEYDTTFRELVDKWVFIT